MKSICARKLAVEGGKAAKRITSAAKNAVKSAMTAAKSGSETCLVDIQFSLNVISTMKTSFARKSALC